MDAYRRYVDSTDADPKLRARAEARISYFDELAKLHKLHPEPPIDFAKTRVLIRRFTRPWIRLHNAKFGPVFFSKSGLGRFDAPAGEFGTLYAGGDEYGAFIETFGHATGVRFVTEGELRARALAVLHVKRPLRLVDLRGEGLARVGADSELTSSSEYALAHRWALAIHHHPRKPDGIAYRARHDPKRVSAALFDHVEEAISAEGRGTLLEASNEELLGRVLDHYRFGLVP